MKNMDNPRILTISIVILFIAVAVLYLGFHGRYVAEYLDDAWVLSWAWNLYEYNEMHDTVFGEARATLIFQRTVAIVYGLAASLFGWSRGVGYGVSKFFVLAAASLWFFIIKKLGYRRSMALAFAGIMLLLEGYFGIANKIRQEPLVFFLCSASFLLFLYEKDFFAGLLLGIALEAHPYAFVGGFWMLSYCFMIRQRIRNEKRLFFRRLLFFVPGLSLGFAYWLTLHYAYLGESEDFASATTGNVFSAYYFTHRYAWRHWPELFMILAGFIIFLMRKMHRVYPFVLPLLTSVILASVLVSRGNIHYIVYIYPAAILLLLSVAEEMKLTALLIAGILLFQLPQYAWLFWQNKDYHHREYLNLLEESVPADADFIYGHPNAWFAFREREFHSYGYFGRVGMAPEDWPDEFIVIENSEFERWNGASDLRRAKNHTREDVASLPYWNGTEVTIYRLIRDD